MDLSVLQNTPLFAGLSSDEVQKALEALSPVVRDYAKNSTILRQGDAPSGIGLLLSGSALVIKEDFWGRRSIITALEPGDMFAEAFDCAQIPALPVSVTCAGGACAAFFKHSTLLEGARTSPALRRVCDNLLRIVAQKNLALLGVNAILSRRTIRDRVLMFLSLTAQQEGANSFTIPMDRQALADFLSVDRSALSAELSRMKADGLIDFQKNSFTLLEHGPLA